ncbi:MAG TPA: hypothetical protein VKZ18_00150 [Polyangia bacterium]|nr:hypothetical protein [Polyangia bacterium]
MPLRPVTLDELEIDDRAAVKAVAIYGRLETFLRRSGHRFLVPEAGEALSWDRALFLNLTYWNPEAGADVLCERRIPADVVAHAAWHELCGREIARHAPAGAPPGAAALFFAEAAASAFDLYLVGRLLATAPDSDFITTQVPIMSECAGEAGLDEAAFGALLEEVARGPERAFEDLRALLFDAASALIGCPTPAAAAAALDALAGRRFAPLLHHYQLSNWILYARAYAAPAAASDAFVQETDRTLRQAPDALEWLDRSWVEPALGRALSGDETSPA